LGVAPLENPHLGEFLRHATDDRDILSSGLTFCVGFSTASGELEDAKVDVCAHCVRRTADEWLDTIGPWTGQTLLAPLCDELLAKHRCEVALVGMGIDRRGRHRVNLYLKPAQGRA